MKEKILLIDGNSILNRAFYALPVLTNSGGEFTNAVYGFLNIFFRFIDEEQPRYAAVAFDLRAPTFRHKLYAEYKGTRKSMPEELRPQVDLIKNLLKLMRVKIFALEGWEADDILGALAVQAEESDLMPVIITGDRDLLQIATDTVKVRIPKTKGGKTEVEDYLAADVLERIGVTPTEYIDVKALMGDTSDNIPGAPGIGEKIAVKLIQTYKTLENCLALADEVKPARASASLKENKELILLSKQLAAIAKDAPVKLNIEETLLDELYNEAAMAEIQRLECKSILPRFSSRNRIEESSPSDRRGPIRSETEAAALLAELADESSLTSFIPLFEEGEFFGIAFVVNKNDHVSSIFIQTSDSLSTMRLIELCGGYFASNADKLTHDIKSSLSFLRFHGYPLNHVIFDTMLAGYILNASKPAYDISDITAEFLNYGRVQSPKSFWGKGKTKRAISEIPDGELTAYACSRAEAVLQSYPVMRGKLFENGQTELYEQIEFPLAETLSEMESAGIKVNREELIRYGDELQSSVDSLTREIYSLAGENFNINSPTQLRVILFEKLGLKSGKKTKQGYSTAAESLEKLKADHPIVSKILEYRTYAKLKSTYADGLLNAMDPTTSRIYSTFNQTIASTGRISSTEPNLQNIPIRVELGRRLRKAFIPEDGFIFLDGDYSQIELRVLAHLSGDEVLINAFKEGQDIHRLTASQVFNTPFDQVTQEQRGAAKAVNFGIVYGISAFSLSEDLGISKKEAEAYISGYFAKYPKVKEYLDNAVANAKRDGYAATIFGRRRRIPELSSSNFNDRSFGERVAMNMPVQGAAADIIKIAMIRVSNRLKSENKASRLILQVHDELLLEVKLDELESVSTLLKDEMENAVSLSVPLKTDLHTGETWYDAK
ncbi:MAG: DNA polymerase I [Clostridiales bacterium]|jgi:DNA polymerase-1|nr:DNA polymerase I [Clostridiales bacterium]